MLSFHPHPTLRLPRASGVPHEHRLKCFQRSQESPRVLRPELWIWNQGQRLNIFFKLKYNEHITLSVSGLPWWPSG